MYTQATDMIASDCNLSVRENIILLRGNLKPPGGQILTCMPKTVHVRYPWDVHGRISKTGRSVDVPFVSKTVRGHWDMIQLSYEQSVFTGLLS